MLLLPFRKKSNANRHFLYMEWKTKLWTILNSRFNHSLLTIPPPLSFYKLYWDRDHIYLVFVWVVSIQLPLKSLLKQFKAVNKMLDTDERPNAMRFGTQVDCEQCQRKTRQYAREMYARVHIFSILFCRAMFLLLLFPLSLFLFLFPTILLLNEL